jgi:alpha-galactosidase
MLRTLCASILLVCSLSALASDPGYYIRKATWYETMRLSREALAERQMQGKEIKDRLLSSWRYAGPFRATASSPFSELFPPERDLSPDTGFGAIRWNDRPDWKDGTLIDLGTDTMCAHFMYRAIQVPRDTTIYVSLGSDDGIKVWLNGRNLLSHNTDRGAEADQERVAIPLHAGKHTLLVKVNNHAGPSGFYFKVEDTGVRKLWELVRRDFPDSVSLKQMDWEIEDTIWADDWPAGEIQPLAIRYADHTLSETFGEFHAVGIQARSITTPAELWEIRDVYLAARKAQFEPEILTPKAPATPRINYPHRVGARPGNPFLFTIPISGDRPLTVKASGLPAGLKLDQQTGIITGKVDKPGTYQVVITAKNARGSAKGKLTIEIGKTIALTPPLGWNSWNCFATAVDDYRVRSAADAMVKSGLVQHGWAYINIDDCWEIKPGSDDPLLSGPQRDAAGMIRTNSKFPDMRALADYVHSLGLRMGIYSSPGPLTCAGFTASYSHEVDDARQYAAWGIDYLKYDWCSYGQIAKDRSLPELKKPYTAMRAALDGVRRDIVFSLCQYGMGDVWKWGAEVGGNSWRTTGDITDTWESMSGIGFSQAGHEPYAGPGHWNDPDMLVVGKVGWGPALHQTHLTPDEQYTHISLWCLLVSPLLIGCDMTDMDAFTLSLLTNDEVLAVSQDLLGKQAQRISKDKDLEVWAKRMEDGSYAVGLFNRGRWKNDVSVNWSDLGLKGVRTVHDLWRQKDLGKFPKGFSAPVARHGVVLVRVR